MRRAVTVLAALAALSPSPAPHAAPPAAKVIETHAQKMRGDGKDENVKSTSVTNDPNKRVPPPPAKAAHKERGDARHCDIHVDNRTPWKVQIFIDGEFEELVPAWGDATSGTVVGKTRL